MDSTESASSSSGPELRLEAGTGIVFSEPASTAVAGTDEPIPAVFSFRSTAETEREEFVSTTVPIGEAGEASVFSPGAISSC